MLPRVSLAPTRAGWEENDEPARRYRSHLVHACEKAWPGGREITAWAAYDFASNAFNTLVVTFIFSRYFQSVVAPDEFTGGVLWTGAVNVSAILVALSMPIMGAIADYSGRKKQFLGWTTAGAILLAGGLFFTGPGVVVEPLVLFIPAKVLFEAAAVFYNGFLPELTSPKRMGRISGYGWATGYAGGLLCLIVALGMVREWLPETDFLNVRATNLLVAGWYLLFVVPFFLLVRERQPRRSAALRLYVAAGVPIRGVTPLVHGLETELSLVRAALAPDRGPRGCRDGRRPARPVNGSSGAGPIGSNPRQHRPGAGQYGPGRLRGKGRDAMNHEAHQKVTSSHLSRRAYLYVRQSSIRQVMENTERRSASTRSVSARSLSAGRTRASSSWIPTVRTILLHLEIPHRPPPVAPACAPPQAERSFDQTPAFDPSNPEPAPEPDFDQSPPDPWDP